MRSLIVAALLTLLSSLALDFPPTPFEDGVLLNLTLTGGASCRFTNTEDGLLINDKSQLCLTATDPSSSNCVLYLADCKNKTFNKWTWVGAEMDGGIMYVGPGAQGQQCLTGVDPRGSPASAAVLSTCTFAPWQQLTSENDGNGTLSLDNLPAGRGELFVCAPDVS